MQWFHEFFLKTLASQWLWNIPTPWKSTTLVRFSIEISLRRHTISRNVLKISASPHLVDPLTEAANAHLAALAQQAEAEAIANQNAEITTNQNAENEPSEPNVEENDAKPKVDNENPEETKGKIY